MGNMVEKKEFNYVFGLINLAVVFGIVWLLWYLFMNPNAVMKLYTPMYGFSLIVVFVASIVLLSHVFEFGTASDSSPGTPNTFLKGIGTLVLAVVLMYVLEYVVFWGFIGKYGVAYFSPNSIVAAGGTGAEPFMARENTSTAIVYYFTAFLWMALFWNLGFGKWPWQRNGRGVRSWSKFFTIFFFVTILFAILFHPHVCYLFYPAQTMAGVEPWWADFCGTGSAFFSLGLILCTLVWIVFSDLLWEGYPWKLLESGEEGALWKGIVTFVATLVLGAILLYVLLKIFIIFWDEPFVGGQYTDGPDWRFIHAGEVSGFFILSAFILKNYFNNFPNFAGIWGRSFLRTLIALSGGMLIYWFYYSSLSTFFLAKVEGFAQPGDTPLVWTLLFLSIILIQSNFFGRWPLKGFTSLE
jgi:amino acid transporter, AAT family